MERDGAFPDLGGRDPYEVLGLTPAATPDEIRSARRTVQMAVHPDRQGDPEESKLVNYAAQILLDESTRRRYDELIQRRAPRYFCPKISTAISEPIAPMYIQWTRSSRTS